MSAHRILESIDKQNRRQGALPEFRPGDSVKVWAKIREGEKTRLQAFEGVCIRRVRKGARSTFTRGCGRLGGLHAQVGTLPRTQGGVVAAGAVVTLASLRLARREA